MIMKNILFLSTVCLLSFMSIANAANAIVIIGASTAYGTGPSNISNSWAQRYTRYVKSVDPQATVTNLAVGGYVTAQLMPTGSSTSADANHNITKALSLNPTAIILNMGTNDMATGTALSVTLANYAAIVNAAKNASVPIWVTTTQPRNIDSVGRWKLMAARDTIYSRYGTRAINFWDPFANSDGTVVTFWGAGDGIHLNDTAHAILFQRVKEKNILITTSMQNNIRPGANKSPLSINLRRRANQIDLAFEPVFFKSFTVSLFKVDGAIVKTDKCCAMGGVSKHVIDMVSVQPGDYIVQVSSLGTNVFKEVLWLRTH
jgi:lysophospholipase L1-like esterase